ncbi:hypothetical protein HMPREF0307_00415 [Corynebacterium sp. DNF00584]|nr:hypothetical protein HMPREF0307_00415 [Corynebacterium sp. DNF00584]
MLHDGVEDGGDGLERHGEDDECAFFLCAGENAGQVIGDVKALLSGAAGAGGGVVIAEYGMFACGQIAQQRAADEAEANNADRAGDGIRIHMTIMAQPD